METGEVDGVLKFDNGASVFVSGGNNIGRVGILMSIEAHPGSYDIAHVKDASGHSFATRKDNIFIIGGGKSCEITLHKRKGIKQSLVEERDERLGRSRDEEEDEAEDEAQDAAADDSDE